MREWRDNRFKDVYGEIQHPREQTAILNTYPKAVRDQQDRMLGTIYVKTRQTVSVKHHRNMNINIHTKN